MEKLLGALPVVAGFCSRLKIRDVVDAACPVRDLAGLTHGQVIEARWLSIGVRRAPKFTTSDSSTAVTTGADTGDRQGTVRHYRASSAGPQDVSRAARKWLRIEGVWGSNPHSSTQVRGQFRSSELAFLISVQPRSTAVGLPAAGRDAMRYIWAKDLAKRQL
ncbi:hypothetical protein [Acrocarpospora macrocephala]|uniref:hypothetical protein n=1 Tax=Acrocarpospora macrocephala TaxID=150177 RepID=UPI001581893C|nr:hypothetical protein [Acrocarpospora macrocephala]